MQRNKQKSHNYQSKEMNWKNEFGPIDLCFLPPNSLLTKWKVCIFLFQTLSFFICYLFDWYSTWGLRRKRETWRNMINTRASCPTLIRVVRHKESEHWINHSPPPWWPTSIFIWVKSFVRFCFRSLFELLWSVSSIVIGFCRVSDFSRHPCVVFANQYKSSQYYSV